MDDARPPCKLPREYLNADGCYPMWALSSASDCQLIVTPGERLCFTTANTIVDKHGHKVDGDYDPKAKDGCDHQDTPEWKREHRRNKETTVEHVESTTETPTATATPVPMQAITTSTANVDHAIEQVKSLAGADAGPGLLIAGAATLAVVGAAIKIVPTWLKGKQELEAKRLELEQDKHEDKHEACAAERVTLEAKLSALEARLVEIAAKADKVAEPVTFDAPDFDGLVERIETLEKAAAPKKPAAKPKSKARR